LKKNNYMKDSKFKKKKKNILKIQILRNNSNLNMMICSLIKT